MPCARTRRGKRLCGVRPQADSYKRERFDAFWKVRPQSKPAVGARLRANAEGTERFQQVRPQADSYSASSVCTGQPAMSKPAVGARLRANTEGHGASCGSAVGAFWV